MTYTNATEIAQITTRQFGSVEAAYRYCERIAMADGPFARDYQLAANMLATIVPR